MMIDPDPTTPDGNTDTPDSGAGYGNHGQADETPDSPAPDADQAD